MLLTVGVFPWADLNESTLSYRLIGWSLAALTKCQSICIHKQSREETSTGTGEGNLQMSCINIIHQKCSLEFDWSNTSSNSKLGNKCEMFQFKYNRLHLALKVCSKFDIVCSLSSQSSLSKTFHFSEKVMSIEKELHHNYIIFYRSNDQMAYGSKWPVTVTQYCLVDSDWHGWSNLWQTTLSKIQTSRWSYMTWSPMTLNVLDMIIV